MNEKEYQKLYQLESFYWWHVGRRYIISALLNRFLFKSKIQILDVGCGTGRGLQFFSRYGKVIGVDNSLEALKFCSKRKNKDVLLCSAESLALAGQSVDLIGMLDILEHIDNDLITLKEIFRVLKPGGIIMVTVPSYRFLWSEHDEALNHKRRYSKKDLKSKITKAGFKIKKLSFTITTFFFPILLYRLLQKLIMRSSFPKTSYVILPDWLNKLFINLLRFEAKVIKYFNLPFGVSLICIAEKSNSQS